MRKIFFPFFCLLTIGILVLTACNLPGGATPTPTEVIPPTSTEDTAATAAFVAMQTKQAEPTETPTATATETFTPEPSATATPEVVMAEVVRETNCRIGPAGNYDLVAKYEVGQALEVIANDLGAGYVVVQNPEKTEEQCYLLTQNIKISGDTSVLPKFTPLPSPTAAPYFELSFKKTDTCSGQSYVLFTVVNKGSIPFRSAYIKVTDQNNGKSVEQALNAFDLRVKCTLAKNIAPLNPGETGYVASPQFTWNIHGNKLRAVIMLCTDKSLKGTCVTRSMDIKP